MRRLAPLCAALILTVATAPRALASADPDTAQDVTVSGTVTDAGTGDPIADVCVLTQPTGRNYYDQRTCTDDSGAYTFVADAGKYQVMFDPIHDAYGSQWWDGADTPADAAELVLRRGDSASNIDAALLPGATMTGRAIDGATGKRLEDACIEISSAGVEDSVAYLNDAPKHWAGAACRRASSPSGSDRATSTFDSPGRMTR